MLSKWWAKLREFLEEIYDPGQDLGKITQEHLYDLNAKASRNWWYDKRGNRWPLRDSL